jgi:hypothetical protein
MNIDLKKNYPNRMRPQTQISAALIVSNATMQNYQVLTLGALGTIHCFFYLNGRVFSKGGSAIIIVIGLS